MSTPRVSRTAFTLTPREREVLNLKAQGLSYRDIATRLGISITGAKQHAYKAQQKVDAVEA